MLHIRAPPECAQKLMEWIGAYGSVIEPPQRSRDLDGAVEDLDAREARGSSGGAVLFRRQQIRHDPAFAPVAYRPLLELRTRPAEAHVLGDDDRAAMREEPIRLLVESLLSLDVTKRFLRQHDVEAFARQGTRSV